MGKDEAGEEGWIVLLWEGGCNFQLDVGARTH